jgi:hypothetical protein
MDVKVMSTMKRFAISWLTIAALLAPLGIAHAQEVQVEGPLAGAPAVIGLRVYREMRFQIQLHMTASLEDAYSRALVPGGQLMFHPTDWLAIGIWGGYTAVNIDSALTDEIEDKGQTNVVNVLSVPSAKNYSKQIGRIRWLAAPQVEFIPLRGKLGIFEKLFVDTDFFLLGGVGIAGIEERADVPTQVTNDCRARGDLAAQIGCFQETQDDRSTRVAIAPTFGAGLSLYFNDFLSMTLEWRAMPFAWNTSGTDEAGDARGDYPDGAIDSKDHLSHFNHMFTLGFAFYLPTAPKITAVDD